MDYREGNNLKFIGYVAKLSRVGVLMKPDVIFRLSFYGAGNALWFVTTYLFLFIYLTQLQPFGKH